jgi:hypothetical protein
MGIRQINPTYELKDGAFKMSMNHGKNNRQVIDTSLGTRLGPYRLGISESS